MNKKIETAFNKQINAELYSSYLYLAMSAYCESINLSGFAHWMRSQSQEELEHAMKFYGFVHDRGGRVVFQALAQPPADFGGPTSLFEQTLEHEQFITSKIHDLYSLATAEKDYASLGLLQWFVDEQVEEEKNAGDILAMLKMIGDKGQGLIMLDRQLAQR